MRYNDNLNYNTNNITYTGTVVINVPGTSVPVVVDGLTIIIGSSIDYSNATYTGVISIDYTPTGIMTIEATQEQAEAIVQSNVIYVEIQAETSPQIPTVQNGTSAVSSIETVDGSAEIQILNMSQTGNLFVP